MRLISPFLIAVAWWHTRRVRCATHDMRRANYHATPSLRTLIAVGRGPIPRTVSGVPAIPPMPACAGRGGLTGNVAGEASTPTPTVKGRAAGRAWIASPRTDPTILNSRWLAAP